MRKMTVLYIEMGYDDYDPRSQATPSRLDVLRFSTAEIAEEMQAKGYSYVQQRYPLLAHHFEFFRGAESRIGDEEALYALIDEMAAHYTSSDND